MTIVRNLAIDKIRADKKRQTSDITEHYDISDNAPTPQKKIEQKDALARVNEIMGTLPEMQREIITLRDVEGYTYSEIADIMDITVDQVKVYLFRARKALREKLTPWKELL